MKRLLPRPLSAFTLTELLLVMVVVIVLAAFLFASSGRALYEVRKSRSIGNLRAMGSALTGYVADHNGRLPEGGFRPTLKGVTVRYWYNALDYYFGGKDYEPANSRLPNRPAWQNDPLKVYPEPVFDGGYAVNVGYGWNHAFFGYTPTWYPESLGWGGRLSQIERPSETIIIGTNTDKIPGDLGNVLIYASTAAATRYKGKGLYLLLDGHVESYTPDQLLENNNYLFRKRKL